MATQAENRANRLNPRFEVEDPPTDIASYHDQRRGMPRNITMKVVSRPEIRSSTASAASAASIDTVRATPVNIPTPNESAVASPIEHGGESLIEHFMRNRKPSITFNNEVRTDFGHRQGINEPLPKSSRDFARGRSVLDDLAHERARLQQQRSHSESTRDDYDPVTGRYLTDYPEAQSPDEPHVGEARFPLLQQTVDDMARESQLRIDTHSTSLTSQSTASPSEAVYTPRDEELAYPLSPLPISGHPRNISTSVESSASRPSRRTASQRWRDGEAAQDFFSRAGSLRKGARDGSSYKSSSRRGTASSANTNSVASSYLRGFSMHSADGEGAATAAVDAEGQTIGEDYVLGKQIGFGGYGVIKEVTQLSAETGKQRKLAVKIVKRFVEGKTESENDTAQAEFEHEIELWRFLNHPNVLPLEAVYKLDEATFCFIPLNTGGTLFDLVRSNRQGVGIDLVINYAFQLASALRYLHLDARVVHRDVKLENCLIETTNGQPGLLRLCDFGMADWLDSEPEANSPGPISSHNDRPQSRSIGPADSSSSGFAGGSLEYAPPEIVRIASSTYLPAQPNRSTSSTSSNTSSHQSAVQRRHLSAAVDTWAFGVCLYTLITGKRPFSHSFMPRVVMAILAGDWDRDILIEKVDGEVDVITLVEGCLEMNELQRWDIRTIVECDWFEDERVRSEEEAAEAAELAVQMSRNSGGWRL